MQTTLAPSVLVADRDERFVAELSEQLEIEGIDVLRAHDGDVAAAMAIVHQPDVIVLASNLPKRSGIVVMEYLLQATSTVFPVIMVSNTKSERYCQYAKLVGVTEYVVKPECTNYVADRVLALLPMKAIAATRRSA